MHGSKKIIKSLGNDSAVFLLLAAASMGVALIINQFRSEPVALRYTNPTQRMEAALKKVQPLGAPAISTKNTPGMISLPEFQEVVSVKKAIILDARPEVFYRMSHVPGALGLSREKFDGDYAAIRPTLDANRSRAIVVYCSDSGCEDSQMVADALVKLGYSDVRVFKGGWEEWTAAGLPEEGQRE